MEAVSVRVGCGGGDVGVAVGSPLLTLTLGPISVRQGVCQEETTPGRSDTD